MQAAAGVAAALLVTLVAWQIIIRIHKDDGEAVVEVPVGAKATIDEHGNVEVTLPGQASSENVKTQGPVAAVLTELEHVGHDGVSSATKHFSTFVRSQRSWRVALQVAGDWEPVLVESGASDEAASGRRPGKRGSGLPSLGPSGLSPPGTKRGGRSGGRASRQAAQDGP